MRHVDASPRARWLSNVGGDYVNGSFDIHISSRDPLKFTGKAHADNGVKGTYSGTWSNHFEDGCCPAGDDVQDLKPRRVEIQDKRPVPALVQIRYGQKLTLCSKDPRVYIPFGSSRYNVINIYGLDDPEHAHIREVEEAAFKRGKRLREGQCLTWTIRNPTAEPRRVRIVTLMLNDVVGALLLSKFVLTLDVDPGGG